jgi:hypothetical protein
MIFTICCIGIFLVLRQNAVEEMKSYTKKPRRNYNENVYNREYKIPNRNYIR